jgi:acetylornithine/succinyldiaminopimelate/putrescine aminotransferase
VPCAAALATLDVIEEEGLVANAVAVGDYLKAGALALGIPGVTGRGLLIGLRLGRAAVPVQRALFERRVLTGTASDPDVLRLMPPLSLDRREADLLLAALHEVLE